MEIDSNIPTANFVNLNFNLKKLIFSFLEPCDLTKIYYLNKKIRKLLPDSMLTILINSFKKSTCRELSQSATGILELNQGTLACWTGSFFLQQRKARKCAPGMQMHINTDNEFKCWKGDNVYVVNYDSKICKTFDLAKSYRDTTVLISQSLMPIQQNLKIIFTDGNTDIRILNKNFKLIQTLSLDKRILSLCKLSLSFFAVGKAYGEIEVFGKNKKTRKYKIHKKYKYHSFHVLCLLYLAKQNFLLSGSEDRTIKILDLSRSEAHERLLAKEDKPISSLISLNEDEFASGCCNGEIKIWSVKNENAIQCVKNIKSDNFYNDFLYLSRLGNDFLVSRFFDSNEFTILNSKNDYFKSFEETSEIYSLIVTKNNHIITGTSDKKINLWKI